MFAKSKENEKEQECLEWERWREGGLLIGVGGRGRKSYIPHSQCCQKILLAFWLYGKTEFF